MKMNLVKPTRIDFERIDLSQITRMLSTGDLEALPEAERAYYELMEMVRGLRARMKYNGKVITKAGIIKLLKSDIYGRPYGNMDPVSCIPGNHSSSPCSISVRIQDHCPLLYL